MQKIESSLERIVTDIKSFYDPKKWHFLTVNGIDNCDGTLELQWIFSEYGVKNSIVSFFVTVSEDAQIPSVTPFIPSAYMGEREIVDLFGLFIEGAAKGLYLDEDSVTTPLRCRQGGADA